MVAFILSSPGVRLAAPGGPTAQGNLVARLISDARIVPVERKLEFGVSLTIAAAAETLPLLSVIVRVPRQPGCLKHKPIRQHAVLDDIGDAVADDAGLILA